LSLGDRRANAVRSHLSSLGIAPDRLLVVSKGEEAPFCTCDTEDCWQQNRRGHFVITAK
jgi:peptidoglycan-associated lipoprotein